VKKRLIKKDMKKFAERNEDAVIDFYISLTKQEQDEFLKDLGLKEFNAADVLKAIPKSDSKYIDELIPELDEVFELYSSIFKDNY
jgi:hypothetical protein